MSLAAAQDRPPEPFLLAGIPLANWAFAFRIWVAIMLALGAAFWLQLDSASSAAVTVAILAQPRRGQAFRKAAFRFGATIVGCAAAVAITGIFTQSRDLFVVAYAAWMSLAVYIASCYDGNRAYGAVLSGYTVAIIAVINIDQPQSVFNSATARLAVVSLGIASIALVNDVLAAPDVYPTVRARLRAALAETRAIVASHLSGDSPGPEETVKLVAKIVGLRLDVETLPSEASSGVPRAAAAHSASVAMIGALSLSRAFAAILRDNRDLPHADVCAAVEANDYDALNAMLRAELASEGASPRRIMLLRCAERLCRVCRLAADELDAMEAARRPQRPVTSLPSHHDREAGLLKAIYVFIGIVIAGGLLIRSSWPQTSSAFAIIGVFAGLGATMPNIRVFMKGAMIAVPCAVALAGITEFLILDGADAFPLLAIGMAPAVFLAALLSLHPKTGGLGFLMLVFMPTLFTPSNPQSYNPQAYLYSSMLTTAGVMLFALILFALPAITDKQRRRWLVNLARREAIAAANGELRRPVEKTRYLGADRMVALSKLAIGTPPAQAWRLGYILTLSNLTIVAIRCHDALDGLARDQTADDRPLIARARAALARFDAAALDELAMALARLDLAGADIEKRASAVADLSFMAGLCRARAPAVRHLRSALPA